MALVWRIREAVHNYYYLRPKDYTPLMDYTPLVTDKNFGDEKFEFSNVLKISKMRFLGPPQAENFWDPKPIMVPRIHIIGSESHLR